MSTQQGLLLHLLQWSTPSHAKDQVPRRSVLLYEICLSSLLIFHFYFLNKYRRQTTMRPLVNSEISSFQKLGCGTL